MFQNIHYNHQNIHGRLLGILEYDTMRFIHTSMGMAAMKICVRDTVSLSSDLSSQQR